MAARLDVIAGKAVGTTFVVEDELLIGRHAEGVGRLADDEEISRTHARLSVDASGTCAVEDLGSTNGTFVNGLRITDPQALAEGDTLELGGTTLVVREVPRPAPTPAPEAPAAGRQPTVLAGAPPRPVAATGSPGVEEPPTVAIQPATAGDLAGPIEGPPTAKPPPPLSLHLLIDFTEHEARVVLDDDSEPLRLIFERGAWRAASTHSNDEG